MRPLDTSSMHVLTVAVRQQHQTCSRENIHINSWQALATIVRHSWLSAILQNIDERQQAIASAQTAHVSTSAPTMGKSIA